MGLKGNFNK